MTSRTTSPRTRSELRTWLLAAALVSPAFIPVAAHYVVSLLAGVVPTGFIQYDMPYYMANARELFDSGGFSLTYGNPFSPNYDTPRIYFQPLTVVLGALLRLTRANPGIVLLFVGIVGAVVCGRVAIALYDHFATRATRAGRLSLVAFFWGGGLLVISAVTLATIIEGRPGHPFILDPENGWWFLNFGRNLVFPTEAVYHAIFFAAILSVLAKRFRAASLWAALLSASHPFTGVQLLLVLLGWSVVDLGYARWRRETSVVPVWFPAAMFGLVLAHVGYYLVFLNRFPEHRQLDAQWRLAWILPLSSLVPAYALVGTLAFRRLRSTDRFGRARTDWRARLLIVWFLTSLGLAKHELFIRPVQPLHFTRGYIWIPLFLLGVPVLIQFFDRMLAMTNRRARALAVGGVMALFLIDNAVWLASVCEPHEATRRSMTVDQAGVLRFLAKQPDTHALVLSDDNPIGYMTTVYTPLRAWLSHLSNTPWRDLRHQELRAFFERGVIVDGWKSRSLLIVFRKGSPWRERLALFGAHPPSASYENGSYVVQYVPAMTRPSTLTLR